MEFFVAYFKYYVVYVTSTCWLMTFLMLLRDVGKRKFQNM